MRRKRTVFFLSVGILCILVSACMAGYNLWDEQRAANLAAANVTELRALMPKAKPPERQPIVPEPQVMMTSVRVENEGYVGILDIPALELSLPIRDQWSEELLRDSPCLYTGNLYDGMVIAGHNYRAHFGGLNKLVPGDSVSMTDPDGNVWRYTVELMEVIAGYDVDTMLSGDWDLTLFTCTRSGSERYTLRCTLETK